MSRVLRVVAAVCSLIPILRPVFGQQTASPPVPAAAQARRDPQAITTLLQAVASLGGQDSLGQLKTVVADGSVTPTQSSSDPSGSITLKDSFTGQSHEFRDSFQSASLAQSFLSGHGNPGTVSKGHLRRLLSQAADFRMPLHIPIWVLSQFLANPNCNLEFVGPATINGQPATQIHLHIDADIVQQTLSVQDWFFDPASGLPLRVEYRLPDTTMSLYFTRAATDFFDFRPVQGIVFPFRTVSYRDGTARSTLTLSSVAVNQAIASSDFDLPSAVTQ